MDKNWLVLLGIVVSSAPGLAALGYTVRLSRAKAEAAEGETELIEPRGKKLAAEYADALAEASVKLIEQYRLESASVREIVTRVRGELDSATAQMGEMQMTIDDLESKLASLKLEASDYLRGIKVLIKQLEDEQIVPAYIPTGLRDIDD